MRTPLLKRIPINFPKEFSTIKKASITRNTFCSPPTNQKINPRKNQTIDTHIPLSTQPHVHKYSIESLNDSNSFNLNVSTSTQINAPSLDLPSLNGYVLFNFELMHIKIKLVLFP